MFALIAAVGALAIAGIGVVFALLNRTSSMDAATRSSSAPTALSTARDMDEEPFSRL